MVTNNILIKEFLQVCFQGILRQEQSWPNYSNIVKFTPGLSQMLRLNICTNIFLSTNCKLTFDHKICGQKWAFNVENPIKSFEV